MNRSIVVDSLGLISLFSHLPDTSVRPSLHFYIITANIGYAVYSSIGSYAAFWWKIQLTVRDSKHIGRFFTSTSIRRIIYPNAQFTENF